MGRLTDFKIFDEGEDISHYYSPLEDQQRLFDWINKNIEKSTRPCYISMSDLMDISKKEIGVCFDQEEIKLNMVTAGFPMPLITDIDCFFRGRWKVSNVE